MDGKKNILLLGASGSIGQQTLDVVRKHSDKLKIDGLVVYSSKDKLEKDANEFGVQNTLIVKEEKNQLEANKKILAMINCPDVDIVVNAISGSVGLFASYETLKANKRLALANKESLVVGGDLLMPLARKLAIDNSQEMLLPIDSEHGAIFQCLAAEKNSEIYKIHLTASGGPFYGMTVNQLQNIKPQDALNHPT